MFAQKGYLKKGTSFFDYKKPSDCMLSEGYNMLVIPPL